MNEFNYGTAIRDGFRYLLDRYDDTIILGQGLWSPWYVGETMKNLDKDFGVDRVIDTPVSENACTGVAVGAAIAGLKSIVVHPRMDFMLYAIDPIVNQAAKWSSMFGGQSNAGLTVRTIINRGGQQGAQHSQAIHSWFANVPGLRVVMPYSVKDARDLLIASALSPDPVIFIDDRWLYDQVDNLPEIEEVDLIKQGPRIISVGQDITIVGVGYSTFLAFEISKKLKENNVSAEVIDLRIINPLKIDLILSSVKKTGRLIVIDGGWESCGIGAEVIAKVIENLPLNKLRSKVKRFSPLFSPAPSSGKLEKEYYPQIGDIYMNIMKILKDND
jgi:acetoin:2,6-dichlorophenolindophenol oxidoreductase subunit beta